MGTWFLSYILLAIAGCLKTGVGGVEQANINSIQISHSIVSLNRNMFVRH